MANILNLHREDNGDLFLGPQLGIQDYVNIQYPEIERLALLQRSQFWIETETPLDNDFKQWPTIDQGIKDITLLNLAWQTQGDSLVGRAPTRILGPLISNSELENMVEQWQYFETIHSRAYSNIIECVVPDASQYIKDVANNLEAYARLDPIVKIFNKLYRATFPWLEMSEAYYDGSATVGKKQFLLRKEEMQKMILDFYYAVYALEAVQFYSSFACTFALAEQDIFSGIAKNIELIAKDEAVHTQMTVETLKILKDQFPKHVWDAGVERAPRLLNTVQIAEAGWAHNIFDPKAGRKIPGMNAGLAIDYGNYSTELACNAIGIEYLGEKQTRHPIPWIDGYLNTGSRQVAPQETNIVNYRVGSTVRSNDADRDDLSNEFGGMF